jgi:hypothetical protein
MTEQEWLASTDPTQMLAVLRDKASDRKLRLLAVAYARRRFGNLGPLEVAERYADGLADQSELRRSEPDAYWYVVGNHDRLPSSHSGSHCFESSSAHMRTAPADLCRGRCARRSGPGFMNPARVAPVRRRRLQ